MNFSEILQGGFLGICEEGKLRFSFFLLFRIFAVDGIKKVSLNGLDN